MSSELIPFYLILGFLGFRFLLGLFYPVFVFLHELAHAIPALLFGAKDVVISIGRDPYYIAFRMGSIQIQVSRKDCHIGHTTFYEPADYSLFKQAFVIIFAPLFSLLLTLVGMFALGLPHLAFWVYFLLTSAWLANFHITFNAFWPFSKFEDQPKSDLALFFLCIGRVFK